MLRLATAIALVAGINLAADAGPAPQGMVLVPEGAAVLGGVGHSSMPGPATFRLPAFWIDRTEVTVAQYAAFVRATGRPPPLFADDPAFNRATQPVTGVTWADADAYCRWAGKRLPSEVEWEKAARGTDGRLYPWGDAPELWRAHLTGEAPVDVGSRPGDASPYGVLDMAGNVSEWVADMRVAGPGCTPGGSGFVIGGEPTYRAYIRGNNWSGLAHMTKVHHRLWDYPDTVAEFVGFRCVRSVAPGVSASLR